MNFNMILAVDEKNWLWKNNTMAWKLSSEMKYFKQMTTNTTDLWKLNAVVMWKNTRKSIPSKFRPLDQRINCILDRKLDIESYHNSSIDDMVLYYKSFEHCLTDLSEKENIETIFVIGWWAIYNYVNNNRSLNKIYITRIKWDFGCDVFYDWIPSEFHMESYSDEQEENWIKFRYEVWSR